jgi:hypothetical protein
VTDTQRLIAELREWAHNGLGQSPGQRLADRAAAALEESQAAREQLKARAANLIVLFEGHIYGDKTVDESIVLRAIQEFMTDRPGGTPVDLLERAADALAESETAREEWMTPFEGYGIGWHESLPSPYTYQASDFSKLVAAVHEYEARLRSATRALQEIAGVDLNGTTANSWYTQAHRARKIARKALESLGDATATRGEE